MAAEDRPPHLWPFLPLPASQEHGLCPSMALSLAFPTNPGQGFLLFLGFVFLLDFFFPPPLVITSNLLSVIWN